MSANAVEIRGITKRFRDKVAVSNVDLAIRAGSLCGFLGPNGAGKSTTLRMLLGLVRPDAGSATFAGCRYDRLARPSAQVGAVLEHAGFHPGRSARNHLRVLAAAGGHPASRVDDVLAQVGLEESADRRVKGYSLGMRQRLALAAALMGDPEVLILDEPTNGLDPPGIRWVREFVRYQAQRGRAVLVSSHLLAEVAQSVDDVVVIARGRLRAEGSLASVLGSGRTSTVVGTRDVEGLTRVLGTDGATIARIDDLTVSVDGLDPEAVGLVAARAGIPLLELRALQPSLEDVFLRLTESDG